ncbi:MAG: hypothetical protein ACXVJD_05670 [Mucilaginibacter sp.]
MKRIIVYLVLVICVFIYMASLDDEVTKRFEQFRFLSSSELIYSSDRYRYGDLYGMSYLPYFKENHKKPNLPEPVGCKYGNKINLYAICDSYIWAFVNTNKFYCGVNKFEIRKTNIRDRLKEKLDTSKLNVLLIELSERNVAPLLNDTAYINNIFSFTKGNNEKYLRPKKSKIYAIKEKVFGFLFNPKVNSNLESLIWDFSLFTPIKEFKSSLNYKLFKAVNQDVTVLDNRQLLYSPTIDTAQITSSFKYISSDMINIFISRLNGISDKAKKFGFNKVYLTIIPNPVSILKPNYDGLKYNNLVYRIQSNPNLHMPVVDVLPVFKKMQHSAYSPSDSHWSWNGAIGWLNIFNTELVKTIDDEKRNK